MEHGGRWRYGNNHVETHVVLGIDGHAVGFLLMTDDVVYDDSAWPRTMRAR